MNNEQNPTTPNPQQVHPSMQQPASKPSPAPAPQGAKQSKKNLLVSGGIIVVVLILLLVVPRIKHSDSSVRSDSEANSEAMMADESAGMAADTKPSGTLSRADALVAYQGKTVTISDGGAVTPATQTQAKGATILVDNNTGTAHTITIGPKSYTVSGLHYTLSWLNLDPGTLAITCDGERVEATVTVQ